jgi:hypothetical protein
MNEKTDGLKLLLSYNIGPEGNQEYYEYVLGHYIPVMQSMGLEVTEAWHTAYGDYPNRLLAFVSPDGETIRRLMHDEAWDELNERLLQYVTDFDYKVISYKIGFQF